MEIPFQSGRGPDGRIGIGLAVVNARWAQFAFQFGHEFCHALAQHSSIGMRGWLEAAEGWGVAENLTAALGVGYLIARGAKARGALRAAGLANGQNPISIVVPCHRVIGSNGTLTGYGGGLPRKKWLLEHEGALAPAS